MQLEDDPERNREDLLAYGKTWATTTPAGKSIGDAEQWVNSTFVSLCPSERESDDEQGLTWLRDLMFEAVRRHSCRNGKEVKRRPEVRRDGFFTSSRLREPARCYPSGRKWRSPARDGVART